MDENPYQSPEIAGKRRPQVQPRTVEGVLAAAREEIRRNRRWLKAVTSVVLVLLLYVLSFGPFYSAYVFSEPPLLGQIFYAPIFWLIDNSEIARQILFWYVRLWM